MPAVDPPTNPDKGVISITGLSLKLEFKVPALLEMVTGVQEALARPKTLPTLDMVSSASTLWGHTLY